MGFRTQLIAGIAALVVLTTISGLIASATLHVATSRSQQVSRELDQELQEIFEIRLYSEQLVAASRGYLLMADDRYRLKVSDLEAELHASLDHLRASVPADAATRDALGRVEARVDDYMLAVTRAMAERAATADVAALENVFLADLVPRRERLDAAVDRLETIERARLDEMSSELRRWVTVIGIGLAVGCGVCVAISVILGVLVSRKLARQYHRIEQATTAAERAAAARKELLHVVSHDLRSPLSSLVMGLDLMQDQHPDSPQVPRLQRAADRMRSLIDDLLDAARVETSGLELHRAAVSPKALVDEALEMFELRAHREGIALAGDPAATQAVFVDRERILRVFSNLIGNAMRYAHRGGRIAVSARDAGERVRFVVSDQGPGIPADEAATLFDAYRQGKGSARRGSLGLGLFICRLLVEAHGGSIGVDSTPGQGSDFWFELPRAGAPAVQPSFGPAATVQP